MMASLRATLAFLAPIRLAGLRPYAFNGDIRRTRVNSTPAASSRSVRTMPSPHLDVRPALSTSPD